MKYSLSELDGTYKLMIASALFSVTVGVLIGLGYLYYLTSYSPQKAIENYRGSEVENKEIDIPEHYPKPVSEIFITTHNHIIGFTLIFIFVGAVFTMSSIINGFWKKFLLVEPFVSIVISFLCLWLIRFISHYFVYIMIVSSILIYLSYSIMVSLIFYELYFIKSKN